MAIGDVTVSHPVKDLGNGVGLLTGTIETAGSLLAAGHDLNMVAVGNITTSMKLYNIFDTIYFMDIEQGKTDISGKACIIELDIDPSNDVAKLYAYDTTDGAVVTDSDAATTSLSGDSPRFIILGSMSVSP